MKHHRLPTVPVSDLVSGLVSGLAARVVTVLVGGLLSGSVLAQAGAWQGQLKDGGQVQMDPQTRRPVVTTPQGVTTQLWDGVHRMQDGSTVTVRSGVAVPSPRGGATPAPVLPQVTILPETGKADAPVPAHVTSDPAAACLVLLRKACGLHDECRDQESCGHAQQLHRFARDEAAEAARGGSRLAGRAVETVRQCEQALADEALFKPCGLSQRGAVPTPCERLVDRVCGPQGACDASPACGPSRQLAETEYGERAASQYPDALTAASGECNQALQDREFFVPCQAR